MSFGEDALFSDTATDVACPIDGETVTNWDVRKEKRVKHQQLIVFMYWILSSMVA